MCGGTIAPPSSARYCSNACKQRAYRERVKSDGTAAVRRPAPPLDSFVGRARELTDLGQLVRRSRLVTLVGPGGAGKTRLAVELVARTGGGTLVELAPLADPSLLGHTVAAALHIAERVGEEIVDTVADTIGERRALVVLDNCEHVIDGCAHLVADLLGRCPGLRIIATSREAMRTPGEVVFPVRELRGEHAVLLFHDRAVACAPSFELRAEEEDLVRRLCARLDGLPLAIELAARLVAALPLAEITARLDNRFELLALGSRTAPSRHRSLRAAIEWSYESLTGTEQRVFRTLSALTGGFDLAGAAGICREDDVVGVVTTLVAKSLVIPTGDGRFRLLESIRLYGVERLVESAELAATEQRVIEWLTKLTHDFTDPVFTPAGTLERLAGDRENLALGVRWTSATGDERELRLATTLAVCWWSRGSASKGRDLLHRTLDRTTACARDRSVALTYAGWLAGTEGDHDAALRLAELAIVEAEQAGVRSGVARALNALAGVRSTRGEFDLARATYTRCLDLLDDRLDRATCLHNLGWAALQDGDVDQAEALVTEALSTYRALAPTLELPAILHTAGTLALHRGDLRGAETHYVNALGATPENVCELPYVVEGLGVVAALDDDPERALRLLGAAERLRGTTRGEQDPVWVRRVHVARELANERLGGQAARTAFGEGARLCREEAVDYARDRLWRGLDGAAESPLTTRESEVAALIGRGRTTRQIATRLRISERTVEAHVARVKDKLGVRSRAEIATAIVQRGKVEPVSGRE
jgi:non-specific serine/threonine protein kinase